METVLSSTPAADANGKANSGDLQGNSWRCLERPGNTTTYQNAKHHNTTPLKMLAALGGILSGQVTYQLNH